VAQRTDSQKRSRSGGARGKQHFGGDVFPETQSEIDRIKAQTAQSDLIVAAHEKQHPETNGMWPVDKLKISEIALAKGGGASLRFPKAQSMVTFSAGSHGLLRPDDLSIAE
jgi:hypothetical protein